jgi:hypothetical protein
MHLNGRTNDVFRQSGGFFKQGMHG